MRQIILILILFLTSFVNGAELRFSPKELSSLDFAETVRWWPWSSDKDDDQRKGSFKLDNVLELEEILSSQVFGQPMATQLTADALVSYKAGIHDPERPIATFLFIGPTGVGKTELAKCLAKEIARHPDQFIRLNMSEFNLSEGVARLIGVPPGYVDSERGGQLSNPIFKNPCCIVLLDEIEKAHPTVRKLFLHIFDEGYFTTARGDYVDCHNVIFIATTNIGSETILSYCDYGFSYDEIFQSIEPELMAVLSPELYNRVEPVIFEKLSHEMLIHIIYAKLAELAKRISNHKQVKVVFDESVTDYVQNRCHTLNLGARPINRIIKNEITTDIAKALLLDDYKKGDAMEIRFDGFYIVITKL